MTSTRRFQPLTPREPPAAKLEVAGTFGRLVAQGLMAEVECMVALAEGAARDGGDWAWWWQQRLAMQLQDSVRHWRGVRSRADRAIRKRLAPLMQDRAAPPFVLAAAHDENAAWCGPLLAREVVAIVREEAAWWTRNQPRGASRGR